MTTNHDVIDDDDDDEDVGLLQLDSEMTDEGQLWLCIRLRLSVCLSVCLSLRIIDWEFEFYEWRSKFFFATSPCMMGNSILKGPEIHEF